MAGITRLWKDRKHFMWFPITFTKYSLSEDRLFVEAGLLNTTENELLLYRVNDLTITRTFAQKIFGTGTLIVTSSDRSTPKIMITNIKDVKNVKEVVHKLVEENKASRRVRASEWMGAGIDTSEIDADGNGIADVFEN